MSDHAMKKKMRQTGRLLRIIAVSLSFAYQAFIRIRGASEEVDKKRAILLREHIEQLGSVFVKFGQFLSIYPVVLPRIYCEELFYLLEQMPPFSSEAVIRIFQSEFHKKPEDLFANFNLQPLAAASFGQVHEARLMSGEKVVVKVQRPDIAKIVQEDIALMKVCAVVIDLFTFGPNKCTDAVCEFAFWTQNELDYQIEAALTEEYGKHVNKKRGSITAPEVYKAYSSKRILTTAYIEGVTLSKILLAIRNNDKKLLTQLEKSGFLRKDTAMKITTDSLKQIYLQGFFHGDPHPANIMYTKNNRLVYIDFGICGRLTRKQRIICLRYVRCFWLHDFENTFEALMQLCGYPHIDNMEKLKQDFVSHLQQVYETRGRRGKEGSFRSRNEFLETLKLLQKYKIQMPPNIVLYYRTVVVLRNISFLLYPEIEIAEIKHQLLSISALNLLAELPSFFNKEQRKNRFLRMINFIEKEVTL